MFMSVNTQERCLADRCDRCGAPPLVSLSEVDSWEGLVAELGRLRSQARRDFYELERLRGALAEAARAPGLT